MLVLKRKPLESIMIGEDIRVTVVEVRGGGVRIGVEAPAGVRVDREEIRRRIESNFECATPGREWATI